MGDIASSWVLQVGNQSLPRLRSPLLDRIIGIVESRKKVLSLIGLYMYRRVGFFLLPSPFVALVRPPDVEVLIFLSSEFTKFFLGSRGYLGIIPMVL